LADEFATVKNLGIDSALLPVVSVLRFVGRRYAFPTYRPDVKIPFGLSLSKPIHSDP